jgi:hypothetical protein
MSTAISRDWVLSQLAGMKFPDQGGAYDYMKRCLASSDAAEAANPSEGHSVDDILNTFDDVNSGKVTNSSFSAANVVMCSREHYAALQDKPKIYIVQENHKDRFIVTATTSKAVADAYAAMKNGDHNLYDIIEQEDES